MSKIITSENAKDYNIQKFSFASFKKSSAPKIKDPISIFTKAKEDEQNLQEQKTSQDKDYEKLLKKVDALTEEVVTLQMELEKKEKEHLLELEKVKDEAYNNGIKDAQNSLQEEIEELKVQYISSITSLQELELKIKEKINAFEDELIETSIIIASKVIKKEVEENSSKIAKSIASFLLDDFKDEIEVKLLVNPKDYDELLKENLNENIKVVADKSIKEGGVIIFSKEKNLDGTIETRFKKTLQLIKES